MLRKLSNWEWGWIAGLLLTYLVLGYWLDHYRGPRYYQEFRATRLRGPLARVTATKLGVSLRLANDARAYHFFPRDGDGHNQASEFAQLARPGDLVLKAAGSDTLQLRVGRQTRFFINARPQ